MTNDKAATVSPEDARVDVIKRTAQYGSLSVGQNDVLFLIARISALQAENAGLRGLCDGGSVVLNVLINGSGLRCPSCMALLPESEHEINCVANNVRAKLDRASKGESHE